VISRATPSFWRALEHLDGIGRRAAERAFRRFQSDPNQNSLSFKKLAGHVDLWSVRVSLDLRAVGHRAGDVITWVWIGTHNEFDNLFG
jgi:hypothetical protein